MMEISELEKRIQWLEDFQAIYQLLASHPLSVDGGAKESWLDHWTDDSTVSRSEDPEAHSGDYKGSYGKDMMLQELHDPAFAASRQAGLCHCITPPYINITGETAQATNYMQIMRGDPEVGYRVSRVIISNWEMRKENGQWKISKRTMRPLGEHDTVQLMTKPLPYGEE